MCLMKRFIDMEQSPLSQTRNLGSFDPANFEMSKIYQGNFQSLCRLEQLFLDTLAVILQKKSKIVGENFFHL